MSDRIPTSSQIISNWVISIPAAGPPGIYSLFVPSFFLVKISVLCHPILSFLFYIFSSVLKSIAEEVSVVVIVVLLFKGALSSTDPPPYSIGKLMEEVLSVLTAENRKT